MDEILAELNSEVGVKGSAVMTQDGMLVKGALAPTVREEVLSALSSFLISTTRRALQECGIETFERFIITSTHGKLVLVDLGESFLVVMADQFINIDLTLIGIMSAAQRLRRVSRINV